MCDLFIHGPTSWAPVGLGVSLPAMAKEDNVVLDETVDENWEPTFEEIQESLFSLSFEVASSMSLELRHRRIIKVPQVSFLNRWKVIDRDMFHLCWTVLETNSKLPIVRKSSTKKYELNALIIVFCLRTFPLLQKNPP